MFSTAGGGRVMCNLAFIVLVLASSLIHAGGAMRRKAKIMSTDAPTDPENDLKSSEDEKSDDVDKEAKRDNNTLEMIAKEIEKLQQEKGLLFGKIMEAIDESVSFLAKSNDSDAIEGITYIKELKDHLKLLNETDSNENFSLEIDAKDAKDKLKLKTRRQDGELTKKEKAKMQQMFKGNQYLGNKKKLLHGKKYKEKILNNVIVKKKVEAWLAEREAEKAKIKVYKQKVRERERYKAEKCPRQGRGGKAAGSKRNARYPCCRKCCKRSYLGCL